METPKHIHEARHRERQESREEAPCDHSDAYINDEEGEIVCPCGQSWELNPEELDVEVNKPSMKRARIHEVIG